LESNSRVEQLLAEILETQRTHLNEYRQNIRHLNETQREAFDSARHLSSFYRRTVFVIAVVAAGLIIYLVWASGLFK
jgi:hypothetical protein